MYVNAQASHEHICVHWGRGYHCQYVSWQIWFHNINRGPIIKFCLLLKALFVFLLLFVSQGAVRCKKCFEKKEKRRVLFYSIVEKSCSLICKAEMIGKLKWLESFSLIGKVSSGWISWNHVSDETKTSWTLTRFLWKTKPNHINTHSSLFLSIIVPVRGQRWNHYGDPIIVPEVSLYYISRIPGL